MRWFRRFLVALIFVVVVLQEQGFGEEKVIEEKFSCGPIK
jgi:hypothetical protein